MAPTQRHATLSDVARQPAVGALLFSALLNLATAAVTPMTSVGMLVSNGQRLPSTRSSDIELTGPQVAVQYSEVINTQHYSTRLNGNIPATLARDDTISSHSPLIEGEKKFVRESFSSSHFDGEFNFDAKMQAIQQETDIEKKKVLLITLRGDFAAFRALAFQNFIIAANKQLGLPTLREQLRESERTDKADRLYPLYKVDSASTAKVRAMVLLAEERVHATAEGIAAQDSVFNRTTALVNFFLASQEKRIEMSQKRVEDNHPAGALLDESWMPVTADDNETATATAAFEASTEALDKARKATEYAENSAAELRDELNRATVRSRNAFQITVLLLMIVGLIGYIVLTIRRKRK